MRNQNTILLVQILGWIQMVSSVTQTFEYTGSYQEFVVPATVTSINMKLTGGEGGGIDIGQAIITADVPVTAGQTLYVFVGGAGSCSTAAGGFNGGGAGTLAMFNTIGCGGGGGTDVRTDLNDLSTRLITAAGSGGDVWSTEWGNSDGGDGGCPSGFSGEGTKAEDNAYGGGGGNQTHGGYPGWYSNDYKYGGAGVFGAGGAGGSDSSGGGGGGGYYGGGGGASTAGGGGSSYSPYPYECSYDTSDDVYSQPGSVVFTYAVEYTFSYSAGTSNTFYPPSDVTSVSVNVVGAAGGSSADGAGGLGGMVSTQFNTTYGTAYYVTVGNSQGYNGGGASGCSSAGTGGGASTISTSDELIVVAGGGGGAGYDEACTTCGSGETNNIDGGEGGGSTAGTGAKDPEDVNSSGGQGGSQTSGGTGGSYGTDLNGGAGTSFQGGAGVAGTNACGGGGGGGFYGGGGGANTGGGGGSSYVLSLYTPSVNDPGVNAGEGSVNITFKSTVYEPPVVNGDDDDGNRKNQLSIGVVIVIFLAMLVCLCLCGAVIQKRSNDAPTISSQVSNPVHK